MAAPTETLDLAPLLEKRGYTLFPLTGQTLGSLVSKGNVFRTDRLSHVVPYVIEDFPSLQAQVAVALQPGRLILKGTKHQSWGFQMELLEIYKKRVEGEFVGMTVIPGNAADIAEIAFQHFARTGEYLFGPKNHHVSTRTTTRTLEFGTPLGMAIVGGFYDSKKRFDAWPFSSGKQVG